MDIESLLRLGASAFINSRQSGEAGSQLDSEVLISALSDLIGGENGFDLSRLLSNMQEGGLLGLAQSWLGEGENQSIGVEQVMSLFGSEKISAFASQLGISESDALGGLSEALPQMVDQASTGENLLDSVGGIEGALGLAGKFFGK